MMDAGMAYGPTTRWEWCTCSAWCPGTCFVVMRIQEKFPDCEAMRKIDDQH